MKNLEWKPVITKVGANWDILQAAFQAYSKKNPGFSTFVFPKSAPTAKAVPAQAVPRQAAPTQATSINSYITRINAGRPVLTKASNRKVSVVFGDFMSQSNYSTNRTSAQFVAHMKISFASCRLPDLANAIHETCFRFIIATHERLTSAQIEDLQATIKRQRNIGLFETTSGWIE